MLPRSIYSVMDLFVFNLGGWFFEKIGLMLAYVPDSVAFYELPILVRGTFEWFIVLGAAFIIYLLVAPSKYAEEQPDQS